jgi:hypothetical protein
MLQLMASYRFAILQGAPFEATNQKSRKRLWAP